MARRWLSLSAPEFTMLSLLASFAFANEISAGYLFPGAAAADKGSVNAGASGGMIFTGSSPISFVSLDASVAPTDRLGLRASFVTAGDVLPTDGVAGATFGARYLLVNTEKLRVAPFVMAGIGGAPGDVAFGGLAAGVSLEAGGPNVWFDCAVPLVGALIAPDGYAEDSVTAVGFPLTVVGTELGVNGKIGEHHHLRAGLASAVPVVSYRYEASRWYLGVTAGALPIESALAALSIEGGARF